LQETVPLIWPQKLRSFFLGLRSSQLVALREVHLKETEVLWKVQQASPFSAV